MVKQAQAWLFVMVVFLTISFFPPTITEVAASKADRFYFLSKVYKDKILQYQRIPDFLLTGEKELGFNLPGGRHFFQGKKLDLAAADSSVMSDKASEVIFQNQRMTDQEGPQASEKPDASCTGQGFCASVKKGRAENVLTYDSGGGASSPKTAMDHSGVSQAGGMPVQIEADSMAYDNNRDVYVASGNVVIIYGAGKLTADRAEYDRKNNLAAAEGQAFLQMDRDSLQGDKIVVNVENKTGVAYHSKAFYDRNHFYVRGDRIEKTGENTYFIENPVATTCDGDRPAWEIAGSSMKVTLEGYGVMKNGRMMAKGLPVFYAPFIPFPAKTKRQSGFLLPYLSYSQDKDGLDVEVPFFWAISPQMDATFYSRYLEKRGFKEGMELRYYAGEKSFGTFYGDYMEDNKRVTEQSNTGMNRDWQEMHRRWSYYLNHQTNFDSRFYLRTDLRRVSDAWYFRDFNAHNYYSTHYSASEEDPFKKVPFQGNESMPYLESSVRLFKGWDNYSLMARIRSTDDFAAANNDRTLQQYPEILVNGIRQPLFSTPAYIEFEGAYDYFYRGEGQKGHYAEMMPTLSLPFRFSRYVKVTPQLSVREVFWSRDDDQATSGNRSGDRTVFNAGLSISSRISRVFPVHFQNWEKIRHEIKPEIFYSYIPSVLQDNLPDYLPWGNSFLASSLSANMGNAGILASQNAAAWALTNTLTARLKSKDGGSHYLEWLRLKLFQVYDISEARKDLTGVAGERRPLSDIGMELDFRPHSYVAFAARNKYSIYGGWQEMNYDLGLSDWRGDRLNFGYRYTLDAIEELNVDLKAVVTRHLSGRLVHRFDQLNNQTVESTVGLMYMAQCWGVGVDYTKTHDDERVMLKFSLAGLGAMGF